MDAVAPRVADRWRIRCQAALKGLSVSDEEQVESHGQTFSWKIYYKSVRLGEQQFVSIFLRNTSAAKIFQTKILRQEANLRSILNALSSNVWFVNARLEVLDFNDSTFTYFLHTYNVTLVSERSFIELLPESMGDLRQRWLDRLTLVLTAKEKRSFVERTSVNGQEVVNETRIAPVLVDGTVIGLTISVDDITKTELAERKQREQLQKMERLGAEIDNFLFGVSHDLRAPLSSIVGMITVIKRGSTPDEALLNHIETTVKKLDRFVSNVIAYSREHKVGLANEKIDFEIMIPTVIDSLRFFDRLKDVKCTYRIERSTPFFSDQNRLETILRNTLFGVLQSSDLTNTFSIAIDVSVTRENASIELTDDFAWAIAGLNKGAFRLFFEGAEITTGAGLALSLVKHTIDKLKGNILVTSNNGRDSVVINIPNQPQLVL